ncbi:MAG: hypothetical protein DMG72_11050 [Acidobacteria bacterium]|nr:MAG: hypothetical protein DMG72_11050 [Acidobacteriota bacterium]
MFGGVDMFDLLVTILAHVLSWMFVIGVAGCLFVLPITAYRLFSALFDKDHPSENHPGDDP